MEGFDSTLFERGFGSRFQRFQDLMRHRVHNILLVSSLYDSFILEEDGRFDERLIMEYADLGLIHMPRIIRASSGKKALEMAVAADSCDLIITSMHLGDMKAIEFCHQARRAGVGAPIVLLTYDYRELKELRTSAGFVDFEKVFLWQGDFRILLAIVKLIEDRLNVDEDTRLIGVQSIIVIEDNVRFYSSYLPIIYAELLRHSQSVLSEGLNLSHRIMRMRARPKILLCETYEEAWDLFERYHNNILGVISDVEFPHNGKKDPRAGVRFARNVRERHPDIPILLQSGSPGGQEQAKEIDVMFLLKNSPRLISELRRFMIDNLSFGDFVFRLPDGDEVARATDLRSLEKKILEIPEESLLFHAQRNHFSNWLKARTEFLLAHKLRPHSVSEFNTAEELRHYLHDALHQFRTSQQQGVIVDFDPPTFDPETSFARIGGGSLGGKGRGLAFFRTLIDAYSLADKFEDVHISVPPAIVLGTNVFDRFMDGNDLRDFALMTEDDAEIQQRFTAATLPRETVDELYALIELVKYPLAVRSSSLLEDSQHQPFAGVYRTCMLPNANTDPAKRLEQLMTAIKLVYASTFAKGAKRYIRATPYRLEEEKMAVVIQKLEGVQHGDRFYPDFGGVARSHNFYPIAPLTGDDGIVCVALGLGAMVVEGGATLRFCPRYPRHLVQFSSVNDTLRFSQKEFYALALTDTYDPGSFEHESTISKYDLAVSERDGVMHNLASTYSVENDAIYDGLSRPGVRIVTFAPILKGGVFPLPEVLSMLLELGCRSMSGAVELEFAASLSVPRGEPKRLRVVQMRPMVVDAEWEQVTMSDMKRKSLVCESGQVLGNGIETRIQHLVLVDYDKFDRAQTHKVAHEIGQFNHELVEKNLPYILVGLGRWGSADPWLGIPVTWDQIAGAGIIVEADLKDMKVTPSQGTHFFQNLASMEIGYFTIDSSNENDFIDWDWLMSQKPQARRKYTRLLKFESPLMVKMDGHNSHGIIIKPGE